MDIKVDIKRRSSKRTGDIGNHQFFIRQNYGIGFLKRLGETMNEGKRISSEKVVLHVGLVMIGFGFTSTCGAMYYHDWLVMTGGVIIFFVALALVAISFFAGRFREASNRFQDREARFDKMRAEVEERLSR